MSNDKKDESLKSDVKERDNLFVVEIALPEYTREEIEASFHDGYLIVTAEHKQKENFRQAYYIGKAGAQEKIRAAFCNGILKIMIPKDDEYNVEEITKIEIME